MRFSAASDGLCYARIRTYRHWTAALVLVAILPSVGMATSCRSDRANAPSASPGTRAVRPQSVSFAASDGALIFADEYGQGAHGVVLAHGGRFDRTSWAHQASLLASAGFRVLAIDFRGYGRSRRKSQRRGSEDAYHLDVLAAVRYLRSTGTEAVSVVGASFGGWAAANASAAADPGEIDRLVLLAHSPIERPEKMKGRKLFIVTRNDPYGDGSPRLTDVRKQYEAAAEPKELVVLHGDAHAQHIFATDQSTRLMEEIRRFLLAP